MLDTSQSHLLILKYLKSVRENQYHLHTIDMKLYADDEIFRIPHKNKWYLLQTWDHQYLIFLHDERIFDVYTLFHY